VLLLRLDIFVDLGLGNWQVWAGASLLSNLYDCSEGTPACTITISIQVSVAFAEKKRNFWKSCVYCLRSDFI